MITTTSRVAMRLRLLAPVLVAVLAACGTEDLGLTGVEPTQPTGRIRFVHGIRGANAVNVRVDGVPLGVNIAYAGVAPASQYYAAYAGNRQFLVQRTADTSVHALDVPVSVAADEDYTVIGLGSMTAAEALVITDDNAAATAGNIRVRAVNAAVAAGDVDVYVTAQGASIATIAPTFANLAPRAASSYVERAAGAFQVRFTTAGTKTVVRDVSVTAANAPAGAIRTIVLLEAAAGGTPLSSTVLTDR